MTRHDLFRWLRNAYLPSRVSLMFQKSDGPGPGWTCSIEDSAKAVAAWHVGTLAEKTFRSQTDAGTPYTIANPTRLGLVLHRDGMVSRFCLDLDAHEGGVDNTEMADTLDEFLQATAVRWSSKSGKGIHLFYALAFHEPVADFVEWAKSWNFNQAGEPEAFPKSSRLSQVWMPGEENDRGGDRWIKGDFASAIVGVLPKVPPRPPVDTRPISPPPPGTEGRPGSAFARSSTPWADVLGDTGKLIRQVGRAGYWRRRDKTDSGISASTGYCSASDGREFFWTWSPHWSPFKPLRCYDKFQSLTLLRHGGEFAKAARALADAGWGEKRK